ncbi:speckle targeted PIP5K1A-regulated poly(A) polymerase [Ranitomeya variabilis]|uniref:speckle targeted PIP5K1A-regulated poly(A) polymerase n=1 Tax=Ranitomeya variabilis TaxID=490064 RepID=UPI004056E416
MTTSKRAQPEVISPSLCLRHHCAPGTMEAVENDGGGQIPADVQCKDRGAFRCLLCCVNIPNRPSLTHHLQGRRHKGMCEEREKRQQQQERSVFVSGFSKSSSEEQIKEVFERISQVKNIVMDKDRGLYAIVEFENQDGASLALSQADITLEGHRLKIKPREKKEFKNKKGANQRSLQPPDPETLGKQLIHCTDVEDQMKNLVSLCSPSHHESRIRELLLSLLRETFTEFFPGCQLLPFGSSVNGFEISGCDLDLHLELGENNRNEEDVEREDEGVEVKMEDIGTDLVDKNDPDEELEEDKSPKNDEEDLVMQVKEDTDDDENITPGLSLQGLSPEEVLSVVERVLRQCVPGVHEVQSVPSARRPVIRFQHKTSGLRGDITLNNRLALRNSSYLRVCSDLDPRVPQLVYTVRYWARVQQLAGNPVGGGPLLNNYALTLLVIFFLQTRSPPVIPSLSRLREIAVGDASQVIDGWDCSFASDITRFPASENQQSLSCLLSEFFSYFSSLDLHSSILCSRDGLLIPVPIPSPPPIWTEGFRLGSFNVQDPFELNHNVCGNVSSRIARRFSTKCSVAAKTCRTPLYQLRSKSRPWGITLLIQLSSPEGEKVEGTDISIPTGQASLEDVAFAVKTVLVEVLLCSCDLDRGKDDVSVKSSEESDHEVPRVEELIIDDKATEIKGENMSKNERKRECPEEIQSTSPKKRRIEDDGSDCVKDDQRENVFEKENASKTLKSPTEADVLTMKIDVWHQVWEGRRKVRRSIHKKVAAGRRLETAVSQALSAGTAEGGKPLMQLTVRTRLASEGNAQLRLCPNSDDYGCSATFFHFLQTFLPRMVEEVLSGKD